MAAIWLKPKNDVMNNDSPVSGDLGDVARVACGDV